MDGIIRRLWNIARYRAGSSERRDNVQTRLETNLEELNRNVESVKQSVAVAMVDEKRLKMEYDEIFLSVRQIRGQGDSGTETKRRGHGEKGVGTKRGILRNDRGLFGIWNL